MKKRMFILAVFAAATLAGTMTQAKTVSSNAAMARFANTIACNADGMQENAQITVTLNETGPDIASLKDKFDAGVKEIEASGKDKGFEKFELQSLSYNINAANFNEPGQYQLNGNVSFALAPASKAIEVMTLLTKKGHKTNINVNSYRGNCTEATE